MTTIRLATEAMRSRFEAVVADDFRPEADLRAAAEEAFAEVTLWERLLSVHRVDSDLSRVNRHAADRATRIDPRLMGFLRRAAALSVATGGAFDPTVGPLLRLWNIGGEAGSGDAPPAARISATRRLVGMAAHVSLDVPQGMVAFDVAGVRLDAGALGKGWAIDAAVDALRTVGITSALLHGGTSSVRAVGVDPATAEPWRIAVRHPIAGHPPVAVAMLDDAALSVSMAIGGNGVPHVIDPRTGYPVTKNRLAVAVTSNATDAEALSTALLVLGEKGIADLKREFAGADLLFAVAAGESEPRVVSAGIRWRSPLES